MLFTLFADIFDATIIDGYIEHDGAPFVEPKAGGGGGVIVCFGSKALVEEFVDELTGLG